MKKWLVILSVMLLLTGCGSRETLETAGVPVVGSLLEAVEMIPAEK